MAVFSVVFQDFQLLLPPLGQNVAAAADYDRARVENACVRPGSASDWSGCRTAWTPCFTGILTDDGVEVSGGEAQKIAIARALYKNAPFIVLDEPTAALDPIAEAEIYGKFNQIVGRQDRHLHQPPPVLVPLLRRNYGF